MISVGLPHLVCKNVTRCILFRTIKLIFLSFRLFSHSMWQVEDISSSFPQERLLFLGKLIFITSHYPVHTRTQTYIHTHTATNPINIFLPFLSYLYTLKYNFLFLFCMPYIVLYINMCIKFSTFIYIECVEFIYFLKTSALSTTNSKLLLLHK